MRTSSKLLKNPLSKKVVMSLFYYLRHNRFTVLLAVVLLFGVLLGSLALVVFPKDALDVSLLSQLFFESRLNKSFFETISSSFISSFLIVFMLFLMGFWAFSSLVVFIVPLFYGIGIGVSIANLYISFGFQGFLITVLTILPFSLFISLVIIKASCETAKFSFVFFSVLQNSTNPEKNIEQMKKFCTKYFMFLILIFIAAVINGLCSSLFLKFFL